MMLLLLHAAADDGVPYRLESIWTITTIQMPLETHKAQAYRIEHSIMVVLDRNFLRQHTHTRQIHSEIHFTFVLAAYTRHTPEAAANSLKKSLVWRATPRADRHTITFRHNRPSWQESDHPPVLALWSVFRPSKPTGAQWHFKIHGPNIKVDGFLFIFDYVQSSFLLS